MRKYFVWKLDTGSWLPLDEGRPYSAKNRKELMAELRKSPDYKEGCFKCRAVGDNG